MTESCLLPLKGPHSMSALTHLEQPRIYFITCSLQYQLVNIEMLANTKGFAKNYLVPELKVILNVTLGFWCKSLLTEFSNLPDLHSLYKLYSRNKSDLHLLLKCKTRLG